MTVSRNLIKFKSVDVFFRWQLEALLSPGKPDERHFQSNTEVRRQNVCEDGAGLRANQRAACESSEGVLRLQMFAQVQSRPNGRYTPIT